MPVTPTYPGVYIEEIPSAVRTITGVATSITAFLGRALRGPVNEAVTINSFGDFERIFGGLWADSSLGYAVRDFYLNGGSQAVIVRLFHPFYGATSQATAGGQATTAAGKVVTAALTKTDPKDMKTAANGASDTIQGDPNEKLWAKAAAAQVAAAAAGAADAPGATTATVTTAVNAAAAQAPKDAAPITTASLAAKELNLVAAYAGSWGNGLQARVDHDLTAEAEADGLFNLSLRDRGTGRIEVFRNLSVDAANPRFVTRVLAGESTLARVKGAPPATRPSAHDQLAAGEQLWNDGVNTGNKYYGTVADADKAADGGALDENDFTGSEADNLGLFALQKVDLFNLLCIPPYKAANGLPNQDIDVSLIDTAAIFCQKRRAFLIIDPPSTWVDKDAARDGVGNGDVGSPTNYAAVFFPRLRETNPMHDGQIETFAPCGAVAGIFARTDTQRGVWKAPAGLDATLAGVLDLSVRLDDPDNGELNPLGINCLRSLPAAGKVVWGARTREGDDRRTSEWKYIPVRRLALFLEESLYRGTQWVVFEPNDEPLWSQIRLNVGAFMHNLFRQGAFQGSSPRDAYLVKCDKETTTQNDIDLGIVNIVVGFAPLKPAEFVILRIQQLAGQIET
jgi:phage tail sheath protein FI